jgi:hypothetical protein
LENEEQVMRSWANKNRNSKNEFGMSLYEKWVENPDGIGYMPIFLEGKTISNGKRDIVDIEKSTGPKGWHRSSSIHTHPKGQYKDFSNEPAGPYSPSDIDWSYRTGLRLYMVPPYGSDMGRFDPNDFIEWAKEDVRQINIEYPNANYYFDHPYRKEYKFSGRNREYPAHHYVEEIEKLIDRISLKENESNK